MSRAFILAAALCATAVAGCAETRKLTTIPPSVVVSCADRPFGMLDGRDGETNYGCATARDLADMVANPADLEGGREAGPPRGDEALAAVQRHRQGQPKALPAATGGSIGARPGAGGGSGDSEKPS